jgi:quercetin dioxygenase-like cupin family protein
MNKLTPIENFEDARGNIITWLRKCDILSVTSKAGATRANHYHKNSGHLTIVTKGSILYYERPVGSIEKPECILYKTGDTFWTGPLIEHQMVFSEDSEFWFFSTGCRTQKDYEEDLVRLPFELSKQ